MAEYFPRRERRNATFSEWYELSFLFVCLAEVLVSLFGFQDSGGWPWYWEEWRWPVGLVLRCHPHGLVFVGGAYAGDQWEPPLARGIGSQTSSEKREHPAFLDGRFAPWRQAQWGLLVACLSGQLLCSGKSGPIRSCHPGCSLPQFSGEALERVWGSFFREEAKSLWETHRRIRSWDWWRGWVAGRKCRATAKGHVGYYVALGSEVLEKKIGPDCCWLVGVPHAVQTAYYEHFQRSVELCGDFCFFSEIGKFPVWGILKIGEDHLLQNDPSHEKLPESEIVCAMQILGYTGTA